MSDSVTLIELIINDRVDQAMAMIEEGKELDLADGLGNSPLHLAVIKERPELITLLLEKGADPEQVNGEELTPLLLAVKAGRAECAELLIEAGAEPEAVGPGGFTPLLFALINKLDRVTDLLLEKGVDLNYKTEEGVSALMLALSSEERAIELLEKGADPRSTDGNDFPIVFLAISNSLRKLVLEFIKRGVDVNYRTSDLKSLLQAAAYFGNLEMARLLLEQGAELNGRDREGNSPLLLAVKAGYSEVVELLLEQGADDGISDDNYELLPLYKAVVFNELAIVKLLLEKGEHSLEELARWSLSILSRALRTGSPELVMVLLDYKADEALDKVGLAQIFELSCKLGFLSVAKYLLERYSTVLEEVSSGAIYPLHKAAAGGFVMVIELLLKHGVEPDSADDKGYHPFYYALRSGSEESALSILEGGIRVDRVYQDEAGLRCSYLITAIKERAYRLACRLVEQGAPLEEHFEDKKSPLYYALEARQSELVELMIKRGADLNYSIKDSRGRSLLPFHYALERSGEPILLQLLEGGANWRVPSLFSFLIKEKKPILHKVIEKGYYRVAAKLIARGEKVTAGDSRGKTALHYAVRQGQLELLKEMLKNSPSALNRVDGESRGLLHEAIKYDRVEIAAFLLERGLAAASRDKGGKTALYWAHSPEAAELLLSGEAILNMRDKAGQTALFYIMQPTVSLILLEHGANVNTADYYGRTPLFQAVIKNNYELAQLLLSHRANPGLRDNMKKAPLDYSRATAMTELLKSSPY